MRCPLCDVSMREVERRGVRAVEAGGGRAAIMTTSAIPIAVATVLRGLTIDP